MNDPNGMVWHDSEWHLFYQYNPFGDKWGHMSWGHAVSRDLLTWEHLPLALPEENGIMIFSGSAVVDEKNTSGFGKDGKPPMVAIYTAHTDTNQSQALAFSNDRGRTWTKYAGNPVLDIGAKDFRDPKVMWHEPSQRWIMTVAWSLERKVRFYSSPDLKTWTHLSDFGPAGSVSGIWECPDLLPLKVEGTAQNKWLLIVNVGSGAPAGGSGGQYFAGDFDGRQFTLHEPSQPKSTPATDPGEGEVLADFESGYGGWKITGNCFGTAPATGPLGGQHPVPGFRGKSLVNTFLGGDATTGTLTSPAFTLTRPFLSFLIGGGAQPGKTCVNLKVGGQTVRSATGQDDEKLSWVSWDTSMWKGQQAVLEIVDDATGGWGHVNADHFQQGDLPAIPAREGALWLDHGPDFYAGVTWSGGPPGDERRILLGWMSNWQYANDVPTSPWRSAMSLPRELGLTRDGDAYRLVQRPVRELSRLAAPAQTFPGGSVEDANTWLARHATGDKLDLSVTLTPDPDGRCAVAVLAGEGAETEIRADRQRGVLTVDRTRSGMTDFHAGFPRCAEAPLPRGGEAQVRLRILIDACSVEVFAGDGGAVLTTLVLPPAGAKGIRISRAATVNGLSATPLRPAAR